MASSTMPCMEMHNNPRSQHDSHERRRSKSICPRECEEQRMRSWEQSEKNLTTTCFLAWSASVLLLAWSHVMPFVPATPVVALAGFSYVAFFYASNRRTKSAPEPLEPLRPSLWNSAAPTTPASPAHPLSTASFDDFVEHDRPASYEDNFPRRENKSRRHSTSHPALHRTPNDMASPFAPNLEIFLSSTHSASTQNVRSVRSL